MALKLFVADDSITIKKVIGLTFADDDVVIESAADGELAFEKIKNFNPHIVLADVFMPGLNGYELCERIKGDPKLAHTPVVLLCGTFETFDELEALRVKCNGYLTKPFDTTELTQTVFSLAGDYVSLQNSEVSGSKLDAPILTANSTQQEAYAKYKGLVSMRTRESFLGDSRIFDLFDPEAMQTVMSATPSEEPSTTPQATSSIRVELSENDIETIVEKVVQRISDHVINQAAAKVVPELTKTILNHAGKGQSERQDSDVDEKI